VNYLRVSICLLSLLIGCALLCASAQDREPLTPLATALNITKNLSRDSYEYKDALRAMIRTYCRAGKFEMALEGIKELKSEDKTELLANIAHMGIRDRDASAADKALRQVYDLFVADIEDELSWRAGDFVDLSLENNDPALAIKFAERAQEGEKKARAFLRIAESLSKQQLKPDTVELVSRAMAQIELFDESEQSLIPEVTIDAAGTLARVGEIERASQMLRQIDDLKLSEVDPHAYATTMVGLYGRMGDMTRAMGIIESLQNDERSGGLLALALIYKDKGNESAALSLLWQVREIAVSDPVSTFTTTSLIRAYLKVNRGDEAYQLLASITDSYTLRCAAIEVASWFQDKKRIDDARAALNLATERSRRIVSEKSEAIPDSASGSHAKNKSEDLSALVAKYLDIGDLAGAESAAKAIDHPQYRACALAEVATAYAKANDRTRAKAILLSAFRLSDRSETYNHDEWREFALLSIAKACAEVGLKEDAAKSISRLLRELRNEGVTGGRLEFLFEVGQLVESNGLTTSKSDRLILKQIVAQSDEND
jgi:hypothetical protein